VAYGGSLFPDPLQTVQDYQQRLSACNGQGLERTPEELLANAEISACGALGDGLKHMYEQTGNPVIKTALDKVRDFTLGDGDGRVDELNSDKKPGIGSGKFYKEDLLSTYFTPNV
jgi:hypothetical protein